MASDPFVPVVAPAPVAGDPHVTARRTGRRHLLLGDRRSLHYDNRTRTDRAWNGHGRWRARRRIHDGWRARRCWRQGGWSRYDMRWRHGRAAAKKPESATCREYTCSRYNGQGPGRGGIFRFHTLSQTPNSKCGSHRSGLEPWVTHPIGISRMEIENRSGGPTKVNANHPG